MTMIRILLAFILLPGTLAPSWGAVRGRPWYEIELIVFERKGLPSQVGKTTNFPPAAGRGNRARDARRCQRDAYRCWRRRLPAIAHHNRCSTRAYTAAARCPAPAGQRRPGLPGAHPQQDEPTGEYRDGTGGGTVRRCGAAEPQPFPASSLDLRYRKTTAVNDNGLLGFFQRPTATEERYRLQQARRVRSTELQYFDHPRFGAIVLVTQIGGAAENRD